MTITTSAGTALGVAAAKNASAIFSLLAKHLSGPYSELRAHLQNDIALYLSESWKRYSKVNIIIHNKPRPFHRLYVPQYLHEKILYYNDGNEILDSTFLEDEEQIASVISGTAGSGKSMFMRYCYLEFLRRSNGSLPIFLELRQLNDEQEVDLVGACLKKIQEHAPKFPRGLLRRLISAGRVIFLLDGFDELDAEKRNPLIHQIQLLRRGKEKNRIIISSRPHEGINSFDGFTLLYVQPLKKAQVVALIKKLDFNPLAAKKFLAEIEGGSLFDTHESFVTIPLLAIMMLITFEQYASIPEKMHVFYNMAFETLYLRHDVHKEMYKRKMYTRLPIDRFKTILSTFSAITYMDEKYSFSLVSLMEQISTAITHEGADVDPQKYLNDLIESVCIMQQDGLFYSYTHRSFQEYFTAYFLSKNSNFDVSGTIGQILKRQNTDSVLSMFLDMDRDRVEEQWVIPSLRSALKKYNQSEKSMYDALGTFGDTLSLTSFDQDRSVSAYMYISQSDKVRSVMHTISGLYQDHFSEIDPLTIDEDAEFEHDANIALEILNRRSSMVESRATSRHLSLPLAVAKKSVPITELLENSYLVRRYLRAMERLPILLKTLTERSERRQATVKNILISRTRPS